MNGGKHPPPEAYEGLVPFSGFRDPPPRHFLDSSTDGCNFYASDRTKYKLHKIICSEKVADDTKDSAAVLEDESGGSSDEKPKKQSKRTPKFFCLVDGCDFESEKLQRKVHDHCHHTHLFVQEKLCPFPFGCMSEQAAISFVEW